MRTDRKCSGSPSDPVSSNYMSVEKRALTYPHSQLCPFISR